MYLRYEPQMEYEQELENVSRNLFYVREYIDYTRKHGLLLTERNRNRDNITRASYLRSVLIEPDPNHLQYTQPQLKVGSQTAHWCIPISVTGQTITGQPQSQ